MEPICCIFGAGSYYGTEQLPDGFCHIRRRRL